MKEKLSTPDEAIYKAIEDQFGIPVKQLEFVSIGESSWMYKAATQDGANLAIKIQTADNSAVDELRRQLTQQNYAFTPKAHLTVGGNFQGRMGELYISVEDYIEHGEVKAFDAEPDEAFLEILGKALSELHSLKAPTPGDSPIPAETFHSSYLDLAQSTLVVFKDWSSGKPEAQPILDILDGKAQAVQDIFARSTELGSHLAEKNLPFVLTHGDLHFGNTLEGANGELYIIDWDHTLLARPGHDLMYFNDEQLTAISKGYGADLLASQDELGYYRNHLMLRFIWFWLNKGMAATSAEELAAVTETITTTFNDSPHFLRALGQKA
jgi:thiamine kinase-like enzyme